MGNASSALPFDIGEEVGSFSGKQTHWRMHKGSKRSTGEPVTIFRLNKASTPPLLVEAGRRGFQKIRTLKHPFVLSCLEGVELDTELLLATEAVVPLREWLAPGGPCEPEKKDDQVAWGMRCLCSALKFLHEDCKVSHSNLCTDAVFVTAGGDWKLGGLDLLGPIDGSDPFLQLHDEVQPREFKSPERQQRDWQGLAADPIHCMDIYALGTLMNEVYREGTPDALEKYVARMQAPAKKRPTALQYLRCAFLKRPVVASLEFLDAIAIKTPAEKVAFIEELKPAAFAKQALEHKVAAVLLRELDTAASGSATGAAAGDSARQRVGMTLPPLLEMSKCLGDAWFEAKLKPPLVSLFSLNDRGVRVLLLSRLDSFGDRIDEKSINNKIFEPLCAGFTDAAAALRELTLKSMVVFIDKLNERNLNEKLVRHLARLQGDQEDSIRTNTIIFLGKVAKQLKPAVRDKLLLPAFARGIKDPFPAARLAGLRATAACQAFFPAGEVCCKVLPAVMPCLIDPSSPAVRDAAFTCVELYMKRLADLSEQMKVEEEERRRRERDEGLQAAGLGGSAAPLPAGAGVGSIASASDLSRRGSESGWGNWALSKLAEKLTVAASGEIGGAEPVGTGGASTGAAADAGNGVRLPASASEGSFSSAYGGVPAGPGSPPAAPRPPLPPSAAGLGARGRGSGIHSAPVSLNDGGGGGGGALAVRGIAGGTPAAAAAAGGGAAEGWGWGELDVDEDGGGGGGGGANGAAAGNGASSSGGVVSAAEKQRRRQELEERRAAKRLEKKKGMVLSATKLEGAASPAASSRRPASTSPPETLKGWEDF